MRIRVDREALLDALRVIDSQAIRMEIESPTRPVAIRAEGELVYVIMPVHRRLSR